MSPKGIQLSRYRKDEKHGKEFALWANGLKTTIEYSEGNAVSGFSQVSTG
jgi:hypothetical protein